MVGLRGKKPITTMLFGIKATEVEAATKLLLRSLFGKGGDVKLI